MADKFRQDLTQGSVSKQLMKFAVPFLLSNLLQAFYSVADMIIVGRGADVILSKYKPLNIFVYADTESKLARCRWRAPKNEQYSDKELARKIKQVDTGRARQRRLITDKEWGKKENYHLCINTTDAIIKNLVSPLAAYAKEFFRN